MEEGIEITADMKQDRGKLLVEARIENNSEEPIEGIKMCVRYDSSDFSVRGGACVRMGYVLPGGARTHKFILEPRHLTENSELRVRVKGRICEAAITNEIKLGTVNMKVSKKGYQRGHRLLQE
jgi:hypothetical protein